MRAVQCKISISIFVLSIVVSIANAAELNPAIQNLKITLQRGMCFGTCPAYDVAIYGDGRVVFHGDLANGKNKNVLKNPLAQSGGVLLRGTHEVRIAPETVAVLFKKLQESKFFELHDEYVARLTDMPGYTLTVDSGQKHKAVFDYVGQEVGMPNAVSMLENEVDKVAGTDRWVNGTLDSITWLESEHFDFHSEEAAQLLAAGSYGNANEEFVLDLINRGAPLEKIVTIQQGFLEEETFTVKTGQSVVEGAIKRGQFKLFKKLSSFAWFKDLDKKRMGDIFAQSGANCQPEMADAVADAGIYIDTPTIVKSQKDNPFPVFSKLTALAELATGYGCYQHEVDLIKTARRLLARGANPNHRDSAGQTALFGITNINLLNFLVNHGANPISVDREGLSAAFASREDKIVLRLLQLGASPYGRDAQCMNLAQRAQENNMPTVAKWLSGHSAKNNQQLLFDKRCKPQNSIY
jgi:hypothetical protein